MGLACLETCMLNAATDDDELRCIIQQLLLQPITFPDSTNDATADSKNIDNRCNGEKFMQRL